MINTDMLKRLTGLSFRQIDFWVRQGYLKAEGEKTGQGNARWFSPDQLQVAVKMCNFVGCGVRPSFAHKLATGDPDLIAKLEAALAAVRVTSSSS